ncbi:unnamed protein product [Protopolystoma xenopodis]|uniref:Uncharacterized protein n=1 Tax=Protopolystoma xenopodis TaxID=117903 RepID=A0A3S5B9T0_9PLAT|nr:unnamed protein product [Protopolystoma xenopodis]
MMATNQLAIMGSPPSATADTSQSSSPIKPFNLISTYQDSVISSSPTRIKESDPFVPTSAERCQPRQTPQQALCGDEIRAESPLRRGNQSCDRF